MKDFSFVIVAGGSGTRMGGQRKQFQLLEGRPLWRWSADTSSILADRGIREIILVLPQDAAAVPPWEGPVPLRVAVGGRTRADSVLNGLLAATGDYVMVHDAARPFASVALLSRLMDATSESVGVIPLLPVADALKRVDNGVIEPVEREGLFVTQTPQAFCRAQLTEALRKHGAGAKDEAEAWLKSGLELRYVEGERLNFKVTWPEDLRMARALVEGEEHGPLVRTGLGYDIHPLLPDRPLILGGVRIVDSPLGLLGHSDADLLAHAVADAVLGAAGLPDIGNLFPASDEKYQGANSLELLKEAVARVRSEGWRVEWVDAVVQAQVPRLNAYLPEMKKNLSAILNPGGAQCVNLKAKSAEGIGAAGRGDCMTCWATATLYRTNVPGEEDLK
ncbi:MAG: 2-C-methyl-D-erythritol 4-phosphate cytidylyltransferase [Synergistaceae bacterium]|nr:2-C-methyl-D-erythritol 4-phosphate cytidylyltransferase [Synergistaceae bacterium]